MSNKLVISKREKEDLLLDTDLSGNGFVTRDFAIFKKFVSNISELVSELNFNFDEDGLTFNTMDNSHISYISAFFPEDFFEFFNFSKRYKYGVPLKHLNKIFSVTNSSTDMKMVFNDDFLEIEFMDAMTAWRFVLGINMQKKQQI